MNANVAKAYNEMKKSQTDPKGEDRKEPKLTLVEGKDKKKPTTVISIVDDKPKVSSTRNIADEMTKMTDEAAMEVIRHFTDLFEINVFSFMAILKKTMLYNNGITAIEFVDENNLEITANREKYQLTFKKRCGKLVHMFSIKYSDNLSETVQEYSYQVDVSEDKIPVVSLVSVSRKNEGFYLHGGGQYFKMHIIKDDVEYEVTINCERIRNNPAQVESYIKTLSELNSRDAKLIYNELISRFKITENEHKVIYHSQVIVMQDSKVISMVRYSRGRLQSIFLREKGDSYTIDRDGTWKFVSLHYDIKHENGVEQITFSNIGSRPVLVVDVEKRVEQLREKFYGKDA